MEQNQEKVKEILNNVKDMKSINPTNLTKEQKDEFFQVYRVLSSDLYELYQFMHEQEYKFDQDQNDIDGLQHVVELIDFDSQNRGKELKNVSRLRGQFQAAIDRSLNEEDQKKEYMQYISEKYKRAKEFMEALNNDIHCDENGDCVVGERTMFLVEYLQSLGNIAEREAKQEEEKDARVKEQKQAS